MLIKTHIDVPGYQVDCRLIEKLNSKIFTLIINIISYVWYVILSSHLLSNMVKTQIITFSSILDILAAGLFFQTKLRQ